MSSLKDIVEQLRENRDVQAEEHVDLRGAVTDMAESITTAVGKTNKTIGSVLLKREREKLSEKERQSEADKKSSARKGRTAGDDAEAAGQGFFSRMFAATGLGTLVARFITPLLAPLTGIIGFLRAGGPIGLFIGALYAVFHDIAENETFQNALTTIREMWSERIVPAFNRIKESMTGLFESEGFIMTMDILKEQWDRIRDVVQDFVINTVMVVVDSITGVVEGIAQMMEGDFLGGFMQISGSILEGIAGLADNVITSVLRLFGADFGENGSFRTWLDEKIYTFVDDVKGVWDNFISALSTRWDNSITFLTETLPEALALGWSAAKDLVMSAFSYYGTKIKNDLMIAFELLKTTVLNIPDQIRLAIMENLRFGIPTIDIPLPNWLQRLGAPENFRLLSGFEVGVGNQQQVEEVRGRISEGRSSSAEAIAGYQSDTAAALEELNAARENFRTVMSTPIVVNNVDNSSRSSSNTRVGYNTNLSPYDNEFYLRRNITPPYVGR